MPKVFATGFLVGLIEFTCIKAIKPHIDPEEQSVGIGISNLIHSAATPPGFTVTVKVELEKMGGHWAEPVNLPQRFQPIIARPSVPPDWRIW